MLSGVLNVPESEDDNDLSSAGAHTTNDSGSVDWCLTLFEHEWTDNVSA